MQTQTQTTPRFDDATEARFWAKVDMDGSVPEWDLDGEPPPSFLGRNVGSGRRASLPVATGGSSLTAGRATPSGCVRAARRPASPVDGYRPRGRSPLPQSRVRQPRAPGRR